MSDYEPKCRKTLPIIFDDRMPVTNLLPKIVNRVNGNTEDTRNLYAKKETIEGDIEDLQGDVEDLQEGKLDVPTVAGSAGQVLTSDGEGGAVWAEVGAGEIVVDPTLTVEGAAADAKEVGVQLTHVKEDLSDTTQNNILDFVPLNLTNNGVVITSDGNSILHYSGTASDSGGRLIKLTKLTEVPAGTYTFSVTSKASNTIVFIVHDDTNTIVTSVSPGGKSTFTISESKQLYIGANVTSGQNYNADYMIQFESGSVATEWTPPITAHDYIARGSIEKQEQEIDELNDRFASLIHVTKNLFLINGSTVTNNDVSIEYGDKTGEVKFAGTASSSGGNDYKSNAFTLPAGTYTVSAQGMTKYYALFVKNDTTNTNIFGVINSSGLNKVSQSFTIAESTNISIGFNVLSGITYNDTLYIQFESGSEATDFVPPLSVVDYVARETADEAFSIASNVKDTIGKGITVKYDPDTTADEDLVLESFVDEIKVFNAIMALKNDPTYNNSCRPLYCSVDIDGTPKKVMNSEDDGCPINLSSGYIGGGHGYNRAKKLTLTAHGKTYADIGSEWVDESSIHWWIVSIIDADAIGMLSSADPNADNDYDLIGANPSGTLTHVSGAAHTGSIAGYAVTTYQIEPLDMNHTKKIILDCQREVTESGTYYADMVDVVDEYDIANPRGIVDAIIANKPVGGYTENPNPNIGTTPFFHISNVYRFLPDGTLLLFNKVDCDTLLGVGYIGGTQYAEKTTPTVFGGGCFKYIPDVLPVSISGVEYDMRVPYNMANWDVSYAPVQSDWENGDYPPDRIVTLFTDAIGKYTAGYTVGYLPIGGGEPSVRKNKVVSAFNLYSSKKYYPMYIQDTNMSAYSKCDCVVYRKPLLNVGNDTHTCLYAVEYGDKCYVYVDYHTTADERIPIPQKYIGKNVNVIHATAGITVEEGIATDAIRVRCTSANPLASAVIELS